MPELRTISLNGEDWTVYHLMPNEWLARRVWEKEPVEARTRRIRAEVPGVVQQDLLDAGALPHPYERENNGVWEWAGARDWVYEKEFAAPNLAGGKMARLRLEGVDHKCHVYLNGSHLGDHTGMFVPLELDVTEQLRPGEANRLLVVVERAPELPGQTGWTSRVREWKARFAYGWDFATRLVPVGIWDDVSLILTGPTWLRDVSVYTNLSNDLREAAISVVHEFGTRRETPIIVRAEITLNGFPVTATADAITVFDRDTSLVQSLTVPRVELWWPNGCGSQPLYQLRVLLLSREEEPLDHRVVDFGVRRIELLPNEGAPEEALPYTLAVNGRRIFAKGWNWVPLDHLYGRSVPERYEHFLKLAQGAHVNVLRVWGGGLIEKEVFYDLCDRFGILVWQELPQCSSGLDNQPPDDPAYLEMARQSTEALAARRRNHACFALWCGGNELTDADLVPLTDANPVLGMLHRTLETSDPQRLWLPTSPSGPNFLADPVANGRLHDVHGPWHFLGLREHPRFYDAIDPLLHSEFGVEGAAPGNTLERIAPAAEMWPPDASNPHWVHHGGGWWLQRDRVEAAFGPIADLETFVRASQMLQAEGLRYAVEAHRRRKWRCSGALPWQFNEPWPNATCTSAVDYYGQPKPAYYGVKRAYRPFHVSAAYRTLAWSGEPEFTADIWLHNSGEERSLLNVAVTVADIGGQVFYQESLAAEAPAAASEQVGDVRWRFPRGYAGMFVLFLQVIDEEGRTLAENASVHSAAPDPPFAPLLSAPLTELVAERTGAGVRVENGGAAFALFVALCGPGFEPLLVEDSHFILPPGEARDLALSAGGEVLRVTAWNQNGVVEV